MIEYIIISYIVMLLWMAIAGALGQESKKTCFKFWVFSPVTMPVLLFVRFIGW